MTAIVILSKMIYNIIIFSPFLFLSLMLDSVFGYCLYLALVLCHFKSVFHATSNIDINLNDKQTGKTSCYLINLDRATERLHNVMRSLNELNFPVQRIQAVDGKELSDNYISSITDEITYMKFFRMLPENGTIGCSLSHLKAWKEFLKSDNEFALICEDDISFNPSELIETIEELKKNKNIWDIVNFETLHDGYPQEIMKIAKNRQLVVYLTNITHAGCYLINRKTAYKLIEKFYPIKVPVDHYFTASWEFGIKLLGIEPRIVNQVKCESQIKTGSCKKINSTKLRFQNAKLNIERAIIQAIYNALIYVKIMWLGGEKNNHQQNGWWF